MEMDQYIFSLHVEQQPQRARMCGFGDKDRRPITPPPCVRLAIRDKKTGQEVDISALDISFFVLTVDLWDEYAQNELNLVVHPTSTGQAPSAFTTNPTPTQSDGTPHQYAAWNNDPHQYNTATQPYGYSMTSEYAPYSQIQNNHYNDQKSVHSYHHLHGPSSNAVSNRSDHDGHYHDQTRFKQSQNQQRTGAPQHAPGSFTRNLIGSLVASAFKLHDTKEQLGVWFVLQDLSVRTEGTFRLKFNFVNLSTGSHSLLTKGSTPVLCSGFSDPFSVYSAKRFPGMIESTDISRKFSNQGIKIPVRKAEG